MNRFLFAIFLITNATSADSGDENSLHKDGSKLQGTWRPTAIVINGVENKDFAPKGWMDVRLVIRNDIYEFRYLETIYEQGNFTVDLGTTAKRITLRRAEAFGKKNEQRRPIRSIYRFESANTILVGFKWPGDLFPNDFEDFTLPINERISSKNPLSLFNRDTLITIELCRQVEADHTRSQPR